MGRWATWLRSAPAVAAPTRAILPECRSILVLGVRYPSPELVDDRVDSAFENGGAPAGRLASYAWGEDYHEVLPERLRDLVAFIEARVGEPVPNRWYTDTGPILERELAQRAGLGWIGKNTCLINPEKGSYYLLAEVLLGLELEPDEPLRRRSLRLVHPLPGSLSDRLHPARPDHRRPALHLLPDHRAQRAHPTGAAPADG